MSIKILIRFLDCLVTFSTVDMTFLQYSERSFIEYLMALIIDTYDHKLALLQ